jgi:hypothetical protein
LNTVPPSIGKTEDTVWVNVQQRSKNISNTNTRLSIGENEEVQTRRDTVDSSSSRGGEENVSNTEIIGTRESRNIDQEKRNEGSSSTQSDSSGKDVSNTNSSLARRGENNRTEWRGQSLEVLF